MALNKITDHFYCTEFDNPFGEGPWRTYGYFLCRKEGNLVIGTSSHFEENEKQINELGGVSRQYLTHRDEAHRNADWITNTFDAPLLCHEKEKKAISKRCIIGDTINQRTMIHPDFEAIPTPGHTPGSTCYLWQAPDASYLFTGDTIFFNKNRWTIFMMNGSQKEMISSLETISKLDFDYIVPGAHTGDANMESTTHKKIQETIDEIVVRIKSGKNANFII